MHDPIYTAQTAKAPEELLDLLSRRSAQWTPRSTAWVFRGHGDANWKLQPNAFRDPDPPFRYRPARQFEVAEEHREQVLREMDVVQQFAEEANRQGLTLPSEDGYQWVNTPEMLEYIRGRGDVYKEWPPKSIRELFALAQHHGVPTRLLDWTESPLTAVYFAAKHAARNNPDGEFAIWAINATQAQGYLNYHKHRQHGPCLSFVRPPRARNANLHAQEGVFSLLTDPHPR